MERLISAINAFCHKIDNKTLPQFDKVESGSLCAVFLYIFVAFLLQCSRFDAVRCLELSDRHLVIFPVCFCAFDLQYAHPLNSIPN